MKDTIRARILRLLRSTVPFLLTQPEIAMWIKAPEPSVRRECQRLRREGKVVAVDTLGDKGAPRLRVVEGF